jgi:hypothetical protein
MQGKRNIPQFSFPFLFMKKITEMSLNFQIVPSPGELYSVLSERVNAA